MSTLVVKEKVEHIRANQLDNTVTENAAEYHRDQVDGEHSVMVEIATSLLAAHYERFMKRGGDSAWQRSGDCLGHVVLTFVVVHVETSKVLATMQLRGD